MRRKVVVLCACVLAGSGPALGSGGSDDTSRLESLLAMEIEQLVNLEVAVATGTPKPLKLAPAVATVITAAEIKRIGATNLDQVLETVPGLHVYPNGTNIFQSNWSMRGIQAGLNPHVLLLINGVPLTFPINGTRFYGQQIPVAMISRIEVMRGPGSAVHGADAFAGTVNVITKTGRELNGTEAGGRYGSFAASELWMQHGAEYGGWDVNLGASWRKSDGDTDRIVARDGLGSGPPSLAPGSLDTHQESLDLAWGFEKDRWSGHLYGTTVRQGMGHGGQQILSESSEVDNMVVEADLQYQRLAFVPDWDLTLRGYGVYSDGENYFDFFPDALGMNAIGNPLNTCLYGGGEAAMLFNGVAGHRLRMALGLSNYDSDTDQYKNFGPGVPPANLFGEPVSLKDTPFIYMTDQSRSLWYGSLQDEWRFAARWELTAGVRYDHYSDFGGTTNPRVALVWETTEAMTSKLMYGRAFRAPSFGEQYFQNNPLTLGNSDLDPETIDTYELALQYQPARTINLRANFFIYEIDDLIEYVPDPLPASSKTAQNVKDQEGKGVELAVEWQVLESLQLRGSIAYQRSQDEDTGALVAEAPAWDGYGNAHWTFLPDWSLDGQYFWTAQRQRAAGDLRPEIDDYHYVNLTLRREHLLENWELALAVRNLFDADLREPSPTPGLIPDDYPLESRSVWMEVRCTF